MLPSSLDFFVPHCSLPLLCRWGNLPIEDAMQFGHDTVVQMLKDYQQVCRQREAQQSEAEDPPKLETAEGMV